MLRDRRRKFTRISRFTAVLTHEIFTRHLTADPCPVVDAHRGITWVPGRNVEVLESSGDLNPVWRNVALIDLERRSQPGRLPHLCLTRADTQTIGTLFGQRVMAKSEQRPHLLGRHNITSSQTLDPSQPRTHPTAGTFALLGVVRRQRRVALLGRILNSDLPGQVVIPAPGSQLVKRHRHADTRPRRWPQWPLVEGSSTSVH